MITFKDVAVLDRNSEYFGVDTIVLMENAGKGVAQVIRDRFPQLAKKVLIFCGPGNNGGDGFVAARHLLEIDPESKVHIILLMEPSQIRTRIAAENFVKLSRSVPRLVVKKDLSNLKEAAELVREADLLVDAMLGAGLKGEVREPYRAMVKLINASKKKIVSVDVPTGLGGKHQVRPDVTVTFVDKKSEMKGRECGKVIVKDIGIPEQAREFAGPGHLLYYNFPPPDVHKGGRGKVLIVGGGPYTGAPYLAGMAALRSGVDLVFIATPESAAGPIAQYSPNLIVRSLDPKGGTTHITPRHTGRIFSEASKADTVLFGPGMGDHPDSLEALARLLPMLKTKVVIDADGLKAITAKTKLPPQCVLTPHKGELERLRKALGVKKAKVARVSADLAEALNTTMICKGPIDLIAGPRDLLLNQTGNPAMAAGGTGDILAGLTAGLLTNIGDPFKAASLAAFLAGYFGDLAYKKKGMSLVATDILDEIAITKDLFDRIPPTGK